MRLLKKSLHYFLLLIAVQYACVDKQNLDQFDDLSVTPTVASSLVYVESPEEVINNAAGANFYAQDFNFDAFNEDFFAERVLEGSITYEIENTTSKPLEITISFLDDASNVLDTETFLIDAAPTAVLTREIFYGGATGRSLDIIRNTSGIRVFGLNLGDNTSVSTLPDPRIVLRSSGRFRLRLR
ncbi:hypothetical protein [Lentiprolixibacter aurantiacus]|uniref:Uncharacterized protein n=1 Tax=Lentiprolixibacter aurantiacus TaxID=2993939 RepID=A0AAE3MMR5_9FLAO|nr:hypothetical protein [Lentiprolixibacter aurantiacus]MCX2720700.1 hypothetical protein [Lentiprolixibacter aurantiacus]